MDLGNVNSHTIELDENDKQKLEEFFRMANSKYILFGLALQLCDVIIWLSNYLAKHNNKEENLRNCVEIPKINKTELEAARNKYEGKEFFPTKDSDDNWHCEECFVSITYWQLGKKMRLKNIEFNINDKTKDVYPYYAQFDQI